jgi:ATP-dependent RNA helicase RhlE
MPASILRKNMSFENLNLANELVQAITEFGYTNPTEIQKQSIPAVLAGKDLLAAAQTGSGKTAAFVLPIMQKIAFKTEKGPSHGRPPIQALILVPTRELAAQVEACIIDYGKYLKLSSMVLIGGVSINPQLKRLRSKVDILVATPGRLLDHVGQKSIDLSQIKTLVLDEADRMLDMGFIHDIKKIIALLPKDRQTLLFSATFSPEIKTLAAKLLNKPEMIQASAPNTTVASISHKVHPCATGNKRQLLAHLIKEHNWSQVLVFTRTKHLANRLAEFLVTQRIPALAIHGNKSQSNRTNTLAQFKDGSLQVLVATDIAARGLDIIDLPYVVNYELPNVPEDYVHRIGRTGRAGKTGHAVSLVSPEEIKLQLAIERLLKLKLISEIVTGFEPQHGLANSPKESRQTITKPQDHSARANRNHNARRTAVTAASDARTNRGRR